MSDETEPLWSVMFLLEVNPSAIILCEKQSIQVMPDTVIALQCIKPPLILFIKPKQWQENPTQSTKQDTYYRIMDMWNKP